MNLAVLCIVGMLLVGFSGPSASAGTIINLNLGGDTAADIMFDGTQLSTIDDGDGATTGNQNTQVDFLDFLSGETDLIGPPSASFSINGLTIDGAANVFAGVLVTQNLTGGSFGLFDDANSLLLSGSLDSSSLSGQIGPPATGALFTTTLASVTGGSLASQINGGLFTFSMTLTAINSGAGLSVDSGGAVPVLSPFSADATLTVDAEPVPEPAAYLLLIIGSVLLMGGRFLSPAIPNRERSRINRQRFYELLVTPPGVFMTHGKV